MNPIDSFLKEKILKNSNFYLILILIIGSYLRLTGLTNQSLWLDEIYTMNETTPQNTLTDILTILKTIDQHPPLYYFSIHYWFILFGFNDFNARLFSALVGIISLYTTYLFAKELTNKKVGIYTTLLLAINYFHLFYSQEARDYIVAFLFSTTSFYFLVKSLKDTSNKNTLLYGLNASLLMYSHYFGIFVVVSQVVIISLYILITENNEKFDKVKKFGASGVLILLIYGQWIPVIIHLNDSIKSFWIETPKFDFFITYFQDYFGNSTSLVITLTIIIIGTLLKTFYFSNNDESTKITKEYIPKAIALILLAISIIVTCYLPYVRSIVGVPMLISRYTIFILPSILIIIAIGIDYISSNYLKYFTIGLIIFLSFVNILAEKKFYKDQYKEQFRDITDYVIKSNTFKYPIYTDKDWYYNYYFNQHKDTVKSVIDVDKLIKSHSDSTKTNGFWVLDAHWGDPYKDQATKDLISKEYVCIQDKPLLGAGAKFYIKTNKLPTSISKCTGGNVMDANTMALWNNGTISTSKFHLKKGPHLLKIYCTGSVADNVFPHVIVKWNNLEIRNFYVNEHLQDYNLELDLASDEEGAISVSFDNDFYANGQDRNFFLKLIDVR